MYLIAICAVGLIALISGIFKLRQLRNRRKLERYSIDADELHRWLEAKKDIVVLDVRLPLDLLAHSEIIPGAMRIPPKEVMAHAELIPKDKDSVVYCTCAGEESARMVVENALRLQLTRIKFLKGGLAAWKEKGYPVEVYNESFHLDTAV